MFGHWVRPRWATALATAALMAFVGAGYGAGGHGGGGGGHGGGGGGHGGGGGGRGGGGGHAMGAPHGGSFSHGGFSHGNFSRGSFSHGGFSHGSFHSGNFHHFHNGNFHHNGRFSVFLYPGFYGYGYGGYYPWYYNSYYYPNYGYDYYPNYGYEYGDDNSYPAQFPGYVPQYGSNTPLIANAPNLTRLPVTEADSGDSVVFSVRVPEGAELWVEGQKTKQTGSLRQFQSPPLQAGYDYKYQLKARWIANGKPVEAKRSMSVRAGDRFAINMEEPQPAPVAAATEAARSLTSERPGSR